MHDRDVNWEGLVNGRDLGGLATAGGGVIRSIAAAPDGGVLVHCGGGRDRAGLAVAMVLDLLGVDHEQIVADHWLSFDRPRAVEIEVGAQPVPAGPGIDRGGHRAAMLSVLTAHPASACFADRATADRVGQRLAERLCGAPERSP